VAKRSEAGWGIFQRVSNGRKHSLQIAIEVMVPETQSPETLPGKMTVALHIAPGMRIKVMLTAVHFDDQTMLETDEIHDMIIARRLSAEVKSLFSPGAQMNPQLHLLWGHLFAQGTSNLVGHNPPPGRLRRPPSPFGGGIQRPF
jgi:hypothetical protein